jgi:hypothetical protein
MIMTHTYSYALLGYIFHSYGTMGGGGVPAGAGLIFEVELMAVNP